MCVDLLDVKISVQIPGQALICNEKFLKNLSFVVDVKTIGLTSHVYLWEFCFFIKVKRCDKFGLNPD